MPHRYPQKARLSFQIFPRNVEHIWGDFTRNKLQPLQLVSADVGWFAIDPGAMSHNCFVVWLDGFDRLELDVSFGRPSAAEGLQVLEKDSQDLDCPESLLAGVPQL